MAFTKKTPYLDLIDFNSTQTLNTSSYTSNSMDLDISMFPQELALDGGQFPPDYYDHYIPKSAAYEGGYEEDANKMNSTLTPSNIHFPTRYSSDSSINSAFSSAVSDAPIFNSDDLLFSQSAAAYSSEKSTNSVNELFHPEVYLSNGLLTPAGSDSHDIYSLCSRDSSAPLNTISNSNFSSAANLNFNNNQNQVIGYSTDIGPTYLNNNSFDQFAQLQVRNQQLSSPLHSPKSAFFADSNPPPLVSNDDRTRHSARRINSSDAIDSRTTTNGVTKPRNKRSKTLGDISSAIPPLFNPGVANACEWIGLSPITPERIEVILQLADERDLKREQVMQVIDSFRQKHVLTKLNIINSKIGSKNTPINGKEDKFPRMILRENADSFDVACSTASGYDSAVKESESPLSGLRKLNILKDLLSYKVKEELASFDFTKEKVKRPLNQFMLYRTTMIRVASIFKIIELIKEDNLSNLIKMKDELKKNPNSKILDEIIGAQPKLDHHMAAHVVSLLWKTESDEVKEQFCQFSKIEKAIHAKVYPNYKFNPQKRGSTSK